MPGISDVKKICLEIFSNDIAKCLVGCEVSNLVVLFTKFPRRYHQNRYTIDKWPFYEYFWPFLANSMIICHKTEVQTVILMCLTSLNQKIGSKVMKIFPFPDSANSQKNSSR